MKDIPYSEEELINMIAGDASQREVAIRILMEEELRHKRIARHLLRLGASPEDCEEIVNDAFVALITGISKGRFKPGNSIWGYLYGAAKNILWKMRRGQKLGVPVSLDMMKEGSGDTVETQIIQGERREQLLEIFRTISDKCQKILHLAFFDECTNEEIAEKLGYKSKAVVGVKKSECLKGLAHLLQDARGSFE